MKYQPGDKVRIKEFDEFKSISSEGIVQAGVDSISSHKSTCLFLRVMDTFLNTKTVNRTVTIKTELNIGSVAKNKDDQRWRMEEDEGEWAWANWMIEGVISSEDVSVKKQNRFSMMDFEW